MADSEHSQPSSQVSMTTPATAVVSTEVSQAAARYLKLGIEKSDNTVRAYKSDLDCYTRWCQAHHCPPFPATPGQVVNYISAIAGQYKVATLERRLAMLSSFHELQNLESPTGSKLVRTAMDGIKREKGIRQTQAPAYNMEKFRKVVLSLDEISNAGLRDKVIILLGFTGAFRRGELSAVNLADLHFDEDGLLIDIRKSKTDQLSEGKVKAIFFAADPRLCPVRTLRRYLERVGVPSNSFMPLEDGFSSFNAKNEPTLSSRPLLVRMRRGDRLGRERLTDQSVNLVVKKYFGVRFTAHSLRASFVTISKKNGASDSEIMAQTFHKTTAMIRRYTRFEDARTHNAGTKLGL
ncbi:MAG: site-specific integrase [Bacteroidota bacterium]